MPEHVRDIKRRIRSIKSTQQITKAMEMVAAARLRRAQERVAAARPYAREIGETIKRVLCTLENTTHSLLVPRERRYVGYVVFTSDRGLCGAFNAHVIRQAQLHLGKQGEMGLIAVGRKGRDFFRRRGYTFLAEFLAIGDDPALAQAQGIARTLINLYEGNILDEINLIYTEFISVGRQRPVVAKLLPVEPFTYGAEERERMRDYLFEPDPEAVLEMLLPRFIESQLYRALLEAKASEHAARMLAMGNATENAGEMIRQLTLSFNKARQAAITKEIAEIVGGAEALKG
ncbi:MAG: ATP synthase F1 subunit gamma [Bacillota bacterium]|nr:ATP synthase F1 subunit gamma [Bacillota bacterium]